MNYLPHLAALFAVAWLGATVFVFIRGRRSPEGRRMATWMLFGPLGFLIRDDAERPMTRREIWGWVLVLVIFGVAIALVMAGVL